MASSAAAPPGQDGSITHEWWWLGYEQKVPVSASQWSPYEPAVQYHLSASLAAMRIEGRTEGLVLDLGPFTDPPSIYQVWRARPMEVTNANETALCGKLAIAGYSKELWEPPKGQLPPSAKHGKVVAGFYQIRREHTEKLEELNRYLADPNSPACPFVEPPRRRVVILIEIERPAFLFSNVDRFRKRRQPAVQAVEAGESDSVPPGEAVFQWWWGDPNEGGVGHWKNYHPHVSERLERALTENDRFRSCTEAVQIDEVRYSLQRISRERPFDYTEQYSMGANFREPFLPSNIVTVSHGLYDPQTRMTSNCFVQFQRGNPKRRRPVRRIRRGEAAGLAMPDGEPCGVCFSDTGVLTGCDKGHIVCYSCLRTGLRIIVGDITQTENLLCGCLKATDEEAFTRLTRQADDTLQAIVACPPEGAAEKREFDMELAQVRRAFQLAAAIPPDIYKIKVQEWADNVRMHAVEHLYHACSSPGCGMENWLLRTDFDTQYRSQGKCVWVCKKGHRNSVLPSSDDIDEVNRNVLLHPEHYSESCMYDTLALRRFRLCAQCVDEGLLTFAVHESGCKQWPGYGSGHRHVFCFHCARKWGGTGPNECSHQVTCRDPGIQQVRRTGDGQGGEKLEIGFINGDAYIAWVNGRGACPPTVFPGGRSVLGETRQGQLGMEDQAVLKRAMEEGTR